MNSSPILIIEDDPKTLLLIQNYLREESFATVSASDGQLGLKLFRASRPQLVILDVILPKIDGLRICEEIRRESNVPILILSARAAEVDRVLGLGLGADDFVAKPFSPRELVARVKALLRRSQVLSCPRPSAGIEFCGLTFDIVRRRFALNGNSLELTPIEFTLLSTLFNSPGRVFLRREMLDRLYPTGVLVVDRVIDVHIGKLRQKIGDDPDKPTYIHTVRGTGYRFSDFA